MRMLPLLAAVWMGCAPLVPVRLFKAPGGKVLEPHMAPVKWIFDCQFPEEHKPLVREAMAYWDGLTSKRLFEEQEGCKRSSRFYIVFSYEDDVAHGEDGAPKEKTWGSTNTAKYGDLLIGADIVFYKPWAKAQDRATRVSVARHEVGHALGFAHSDREDCLMYPYVNTPNRSYKGVLKDACEPEVASFKERYDGKD